MRFLISQRLNRTDVSTKRYQAPQRVDRFVVEKKYFLQFIYTEEGKFVLPFSRRPVDIDLQWLIDEHHTSLSIGCGKIDVLMDYGPPDENKKVIRVIDETMDERSLAAYLL